MLIIHLQLLSIWLLNHSYFLCRTIISKYTQQFNVLSYISTTGIYGILECSVIIILILNCEKELVHTPPKKM